MLVRLPIAGALFAFAALVSAGPALAGVTPAMVHLPAVQHSIDLTLDDGSKAFVGTDHKLYLIGSNGLLKLAPAGHYHTMAGGCVVVGADSAVDPAMLRSLSQIRN